MAVEQFTAATSRAPIVFCDANFLVDVAIASGSPSATLLASVYASAGRSARATQARAFFHTYKAAGTSFVASPYVLEEIAHKLATAALRGVAPNPQVGWKDLKRTNPVAYQTARNAAQTLLRALWSEVEAMGVQFVVPRMGSGRRRTTPVTDEVARTALDLYRIYDVLDFMDAFHVAMALTCGIKWVATSDRAFQSVAQINVFSGV